MHDDLLEVASQLAGLDGGRPRQASLHRSVSTACYALFHALCDARVGSLIGWGRRPWSWTVVEPTYRAVDHGAAKRLFLQLRSRPTTDEPMRQMADAFLELQDARLRADYDPKARFARDEVFQYVEQARVAVARLQALPPATKLELVVQLAFRQR